MIPAAIPLAAFATSSIVSNITKIYGVATDINNWVNQHIQTMQNSENVTISRTGKVLEGAKFGFGLGYAAPIIAIATGQILLGNTFTAAAVVATAPVNPIAMTCASIGAIYYGWGALNDVERNDILDKLSRGLEIGIELIKSIIHYVINGITSEVTQNYLKALKKNIEEEAAKFGKTLYDVTHSSADKMKEVLTRTVTTAHSAIEASVEAATEVATAVKEKIEQHTTKAAPNQSRLDNKNTKKE